VTQLKITLITYQHIINMKRYLSISDCMCHRLIFSTFIVFDNLFAVT